MDGSDDFRPEAEQRASDPSPEEMLRRARDAHLGARLGITIINRYVPHFRRPATIEARALPVNWLHSVIVLVVGLFLGAMVACGVIQAGVLIRGAPTQGQTTVQQISPAPTLVPTAPVATPIPTPTDTPLPTPPVMPTSPATSAASPPTINEIVSLAQDFYDTLSPAADSYVFMDATAVQIQSLDESQLTACIAFDFASVAAPDTVAGSDTRRFVLNPTSDGTWQVLEMDNAGSCSLS